jgi:hypothetical protein
MLTQLDNAEDLLFEEGDKCPPTPPANAKAPPGKWPTSGAPPVGSQPVAADNLERKLDDSERELRSEKEEELRFALSCARPGN